MKQPRRHHYLPASYQEWWTTNGVLYVLDARTGAVRRTSPPTTGVKRDFYRIVLGSGRTDVSVEKFFSALEGAAKTAIGDLVAGRRLRISQRQALAEFVAFLHTRVPSFMNRHDTRAEALLRQRIRDVIPDEAAAATWLAQQRDLPAHLQRYSPGEVLRMLHGDGYRIRIPAAYRIVAALQAGSALTTEVRSRHWSVLRAPKGMRLVTSDNPVSVGVTWHAELHIGVVTHEVALGPSLLLRTGLPGTSIRRGRLTPEEVRRYNSRVSSTATRIVIASDPCDFTVPAV